MRSNPRRRNTIAAAGAPILLVLAATGCPGRTAPPAAPPDTVATTDTAAPVETEPVACPDRGADPPFQRRVAGVHRGCTTDEECVTVKLDCSHLDCTGVHRDHADAYVDPIDCTGYTGGVGNYDCDPIFHIEAPRCRGGCCVSERTEPMSRAAQPDHCFAPRDPTAGPNVGQPEAEAEPADGPEPMPDGPPPRGAADAHGRCTEGDAAACADLARTVLSSGRDEALGRILARRAADLAWFALEHPHDAPPAVEDPRVVVESFRHAFRTVVLPTLGPPAENNVAQAFAECMDADVQFYVVRTPRRVAHRLLALETLHFPQHVLWGAAADLAGDGWVWEVVFVGGSRRFPPSGAFAGFVDPADGRLILAFHVAEG
jgi:hypothetical protein